MMRLSLLTQTLASERQCFRDYCHAIGVNSDLLVRALSVQGHSTPETYLEGPNTSVITSIAEFFASPTPTLCVIIGDHGFGKTTLKDFVLRVLAKDASFVSLCLDNVGPYTPIQIQKVIATRLMEIPDTQLSSCEARSRERRDQQIKEMLGRLRERGITTLVWIDEGQTLSLEKINLLRSFADITTPKLGYPVCKVLITGTPQLVQKFETWRISHPDEMAAFDDRVGLNTFHLSPWTEVDIERWWEGIILYAQTTPPTGTNPFESTLARIILAYSDGQPRTIAQLSLLAILEKARHFTNDPNDLIIHPVTLESALASKEVVSS